MTLMRELETFLRKTKIPRSRFGREVCNDPNLADDISNGRQLRMKTILKLRKFMEDYMPDHNALAEEIHRDNIVAGWWKQEAISGSASAIRHQDGTITSSNDTQYRTIPRNIGELLCLVHSELSEAWYGWSTNSQDDHLPQFKMYHVELADTCIRIYDILGYYAKPKATFKSEAILDIPWEMHDSLRGDLLILHFMISSAMEGFRRGDVLLGKMWLTRCLDMMFELAGLENFNLMEIIQVKREYNRHRADHKPEARQRVGGKAF